MDAQPTLRLVTRPQGANEALVTGAVTPAGWQLEHVEMPVLVHAFRQMVRGLTYDVCEMALTTYLCARARGVAFTALPVPLVRGLHHGAAVVAADSDVTTPADLSGARVGVNRGYTVTTGVWVRGILQDEYGLDPRDVTWVTTGDDHVPGQVLPPNVEPQGASDLLAEVASGDLAAAVGIRADDPRVRPLVADPDAAALAAVEERELYPINHVVVVRDELLAADAGLAAELFAAFAEAKGRYLDRLRAGRIEAPTPTDTLLHRVMEVTGGDPLPYGIDPNREMIERLVRHAVEQGILEMAPSVDELFAEGTRSLTA